MLFSMLLFFRCECPTVTTDTNNFATSNKLLQICVIDVDQGDAILVITPDSKYVLIDGGNTNKGNNEINPLLDSLRITHLDYIFVSHYDTDHIGGLDEAVNHLSKDSIINYCYDSGGGRNKEPFTQYLASIGTKRKLIASGDTIKISDVTIICTNANGKLINSETVNIKDVNDSSVGLIFSYRNFKFFTTGDLSGENFGDLRDIETKLASFVGDIDVYKVSHHGSKYSTNQSFINSIRPEASVLSLGKNSYDHPSQNVIDRLINAGSKVYQTDSSNYGQIPMAAGKLVRGDVWIRVYANYFIVNTDTFNLHNI